MAVVVGRRLPQEGIEPVEANHFIGECVLSFFISLMMIPFITIDLSHEQHMNDNCNVTFQEINFIGEEIKVH